MNYKIETVEDCLEFLVGLKGDSKVDIDKADVHIMSSIARQVFRGIALTDKQYELVKGKVILYKNSIPQTDVDQIVNNLRQPLREIDRTKSIKVVEQERTLYIAIRFVFNKKYIDKIEKIKSLCKNNHYDPKQKSHYFPLTELNVFNIISTFKDSGFSIDSNLLEYYEKVETMNNNKKDYIPGIYSLKLKNLNQKAIDYMISSIGEPDIDNLALYKDRQDSLGFGYVDDADLQESMSRLTILSKKVVSREKQHVLVQPTKYNLNTVAESILELHRFPMLVVLPTEDPMRGLHQVFTAFNGIIMNDSVSVMFRLDNKDEYCKEFNNFVRENNLNNPLDSSTKIVYINSGKFPKPILSSGWNPTTALLFGSKTPGSKVNTYIDNLDLVIHYDENPSVFMGRSSADRIEKL